MFSFFTNAKCLVFHRYSVVILRMLTASSPSLGVSQVVFLPADFHLHPTYRRNCLIGWKVTFVSFSFLSVVSTLVFVLLTHSQVFIKFRVILTCFFLYILNHVAFLSPLSILTSNLIRQFSFLVKNIMFPLSFSNPVYGKSCYVIWFSVRCCLTRSENRFFVLSRLKFTIFNVSISIFC